MNSSTEFVAREIKDRLESERFAEELLEAQISAIYSHLRVDSEKGHSHRHGRRTIRRRDSVEDFLARQCELARL
jgi:hypothetical protein